MRQQRYPAGWNEERVWKLLQHYEEQTEDEALAEDEAAFRRRDQTVMVVPTRLVSTITKMIAEKGSASKAQHGGLTKAVHSIAALLRFGRNPNGHGLAAASDRRTLGALRSGKHGMDRRSFIRIIGLWACAVSYELRADPSPPPVLINLRDLTVTLPIWLIDKSIKQHSELAVSTLVLASPGYKLEFSTGQIVQLNPDATPAQLLALNHGCTSRQYMLLKRLLSQMLYGIDLSKATPSALQSIRVSIEEFQGEEVIEHVSPRQIADLWKQYQNASKVTKVIWKEKAGFVVL